ncbi:MULTISPECIES: IS1 family transposase [Chryseobacterium]|uniref:IS1 family transposase n=1 Tax=Chryseobacterium scophthalmum TaxID=59733 RepID=UPI0021D13510|nr:MULTISPECIES: IS1 family transposase [Chryseobacterium]
MHQTKRFGTNAIERKNLSIRTHLKRLNRKTICFNKSIVMLTSILKIYFWL